jgi:hypothetical protein
VNFIADIGQWIASNESLLSGLAALVVLAGVILSPLGKGVRHLFKRSKAAPEGDEPEDPGTDTGGASSESRSLSGPDAPPAWESSEPILAVLAFDNLSNDPEMQFFSDGVSEEIIQRLSQGANLKVIARTCS